MHIINLEYINEIRYKLDGHYYKIEVELIIYNFIFNKTSIQ